MWKFSKNPRFGTLLVFVMLLASPLLAQEQIHPEKRLEELGIELRPARASVNNYMPAVRTGPLVFTSGNIPYKADGTLIRGKVGGSLSLEEGREAARETAINLLSVLKNELGDLGKVKRIVKVLGMVNCTADFEQQPAVMNAFSDLMVEVFGERGRHARSAVGMYALPFNAAVEIEMVVEVEE
jgi:enamine deaminase RidA (YjgF/YER057c/UK114 family)